MKIIKSKLNEAELQVAMLLEKKTQVKEKIFLDRAIKMILNLFS